MLKKILILTLVLVMTCGIVFALSACGEEEVTHETSFIDENADDFCDVCDLARVPCADHNIDRMTKTGYCKDCHYFSNKYKDFDREHSLHSDGAHGDGLCDTCGANVSTSVWQEYKFKIDLFLESLVDDESYKVILKGLVTTLEIAVLGLIIGIVLGTLIALVKVVPNKNGFMKVMNGICNVYVTIFRGTPMVVQLLVGYFVLLPMLDIAADALVVAIVIFGLNSGAYVSEIMRAGINSVDPGQLEAGRAVGLPFWTAMLKIVIPQSIKNILPTLGNEFIVLVKETSVVSFIAVVDITKAFKSIGDANYEYLIPYLALAIVYLGLVMLITLGVKMMERRLKRNERHRA